MGMRYANLASGAYVRRVRTCVTFAVSGATLILLDTELLVALSPLDSFVLCFASCA